MNCHVKHGINNEATAVKEYCDVKPVSVNLSGLWINDDYVHLAASPDGLIYNERKNFAE